VQKKKEEKEETYDPLSTILPLHLLTQLSDWTGKESHLLKEHADGCDRVTLRARSQVITRVSRWYEYERRAELTVANVIPTRHKIYVEKH
jgi:hypothetical protein